MLTNTSSRWTRYIPCSGTEQLSIFKERRGCSYFCFYVRHYIYHHKTRGHAHALKKLTFPTPQLCPPDSNSLAEDLPPNLQVSGTVWKARHNYDLKLAENIYASFRKGRFYVKYNEKEYYFSRLLSHAPLFVTCGAIKLLFKVPHSAGPVAD